MKPRGSIPSGRAGLLLLAAAAVPLVISRCRPLAKTLGTKLVEWGDRLQKEAGTVETEHEQAASKSSMPDAKEESVVESSSPTGKHEVRSQATAVKKKTATVPKAKSKPAKDTAKPDTGSNPKKQTPKASKS